MSINIAASGINPAPSSNIQGLQGQISTGNRLNDASTDPAGLQVSIGMTTQINGNHMAMRNINDGVSAIQIADQSVGSVTDSLQRMRELAVQAGGILGDSDKAALQAEFSQLQQNIKETIGSSEFNGQSLLDSEDGVSLQTGADAGETQDVRTADLVKRLEDMDLFDIDLTSSSSEDVFKSLDDSLSLAGELRADFGATQNALDSRMNSVMGQNLNEAESRSQISDTDMAKALSEMSQQQVREDVELAMLGQANANRGQVLSLLKF